eukprot:4540128-Prymnesium_polylepis.1
MIGAPAEPVSNVMFQFAAEAGTYWMLPMRPDAARCAQMRPDAARCAQMRPEGCGTDVPGCAPMRYDTVRCCMMRHNTSACDSCCDAIDEPRSARAPRCAHNAPTMPHDAARWTRCATAETHSGSGV